MANRIKIRLHSFIAFLILSVFLTGNSTVTSIPTQELDAMLSIVRARGYSLFSNAITTSDLQLDLLTAADNASFTFFAPIDSSLFALAMAESAPAYTATLRYHGVPRRLSVSDLIRLPSPVPIRTLLRSQYVSVSRRLRGSRFDAISVNGVEVLQPELFYGSHVAVHGLGGILILNSQNEFLYDSIPPLPPFSSGSPASFPPPIDRGNSKENTDFAVPPIGISVSPPLRSNSPGGSPPPIDRGNSKENRDFSVPPADNSIGHSVSPPSRYGSPGSSPPQIDHRNSKENKDLSVPPNSIGFSVSPPFRSSSPGSSPPQIDRVSMENRDFTVPPVSPPIRSRNPGNIPPQIDRGNSEEKRDLTVPTADRSIGISSVSPPFRSSSPASFPPQIDRGSKENRDLTVPPQIDRGSKENRDLTDPPLIDRGSKENRDLTVPPQIDRGSKENRDLTVPPQIDRGSKENRDLTVPPQIDRGFEENGDLAVPPIGLSVSPPINPNTFNNAFLDPAPDRSHLHVQSPAISSVSPSASPAFPPAATPSLQNGNAPSPLISEKARMNREKIYAEEHWRNLGRWIGFSEGNSNDVDV